MKIQNYLFLGLIFFIFFSAVPGPLSSISGLLFLLFIFVYFINKIRDKNWKYEKTGLEWPLFFYFLATLISVYDAYIRPWAIGKTISILLAIFVFYILNSVIMERKTYQKLINVVYWAGIIVCIFGLGQYVAYKIFEVYSFKLPIFHYFVDQAKNLPRISSVFILKSGTNVYACYLALFSPLLFAITKTKKITLFWQVLIYLLLFSNIILTQSRGLYLSIFFIVLLIILFKFRKNIVVWLLLCLMLVSLMFIPTTQKTIKSIFNLKDNSNIEHFQTLQSAINLIKKHPINGWGADHVSRKIRNSEKGWIDAHDYKLNVKAKNWTPTKFYEEKEKARRAGVISIDSPHNIYLWHFIDLGIFGFAAFIYFLIAILGQILENLRKSVNKNLAAGLFIGYACFLFYGLFQDSLNAPIMNLLFWVFIVLIIQFKKYAEKNKLKI